MLTSCYWIYEQTNDHLLNNLPDIIFRLLWSPSARCGDYGLKSIAFVG